MAIVLEVGTIQPASSSWVALLQGNLASQAVRFPRPEVSFLFSEIQLGTLSQRSHPTPSLR